MASQPAKSVPPPYIGRAGNLTIFITPPPNPNPPPVQAPPIRFEENVSSEAVYELFRNVVSKMQDVHSRLDLYLADWFGLNHSKYQWALNDYYENNGKEKEPNKTNKLNDDTSK